MKYTASDHHVVLASLESLLKDIFVQIVLNNVIHVDEIREPRSCGVEGSWAAYTPTHAIAVFSSLLGRFCGRLPSGISAVEDTNNHVRELYSPCSTKVMHWEFQILQPIRTYCGRCEWYCIEYLCGGCSASAKELRDL